VRCFAPADQQLAYGQQVLISIRPERLTLLNGVDSSNGTNGMNVWEGRVTAAAYYGDHREYEVEVDNQSLKITTPVAVVAERGDHVRVACDPSEVIVMAGGSD
jgi:ABC-type Fe3+/spermidine/putrescine transport system ATPase subunit